MKHADFSTALLAPQAPVPPDVRVRTGADVAQRFGVYRNNVTVALIDALADTYPVLGLLVGEEFFRGMARFFVRQHPPQSPVMAEYGGGFADFIAGFAPAASIPYLADVARLEWAQVCVTHAADASTLTPTELAPLQAAPEHLLRTRWQFHPALALITSPYAIVSIWRAHQHETTAEIEAALAVVDVDQPESALVLRQDLMPVILGVNAAEAAFIAALQSGQALAAAVAAAQQVAPAFDLALSFALLLRGGALHGVQVPDAFLEIHP